jgi:hypothetical protein
VDDAAFLLWMGRVRTVSALMVAIGVAGEFLGDWLSDPARHRTEAAREAEVAHLNSVAATAQQAAGEALKEAARLNGVAEQERLARLKLEEKMADRHLTLNQQKAIADKLRQFAGQILNVLAYNSDGEIIGITNDILAAITMRPGSAGWLVTVVPGQEMNRAVRGILIEYKEGADVHTIAAGTALAEALRAQNLAVSGPVPLMKNVMQMTGGTMNKDAQLQVVIGKKP